jgi:hypothetical protein
MAEAEYDIAIEVQPIGATRMLKATSPQLPTLTVMGTDAADLLQCLPPVIASLLDALGKPSQAVTLNGADLSDLRAHVVA